MTRAHSWHGRRGTVILGPTEHRVARYLADLCRGGLVTLPMATLIEATHVERSEAYRITRRLRILGLFGIQDDQGGSRGGRKIWRTAIEHNASQLDEVRHREAWSRVVAWARARSSRARARLAAIRSTTYGATARRSIDHLHNVDAPTAALAGNDARAAVIHGTPPGAVTTPPGGVTSFLDRLIAAGLSSTLTADFGGGVQ